MKLVTIWIDAEGRTVADIRCRYLTRNQARRVIDELNEWIAVDDAAWPYVSVPGDPADTSD